MNKEDYQEQIAKIICDKADNITCNKCFVSSKGQICKGYEQCRIAEKSVDQLKYVMTSNTNNIFLSACAGSGKTEVVGLKMAYEIKRWKHQNRGIAVLTFTNDATNVIKERVRQFTGGNCVYPHYIGTLSSFIHSFIVQPFAYKFAQYEGKDGDYSFRIIDENMPIYSHHWLKNFECQVSYLSTANRWEPIYAHQIGYDFKKEDYYFYVGNTTMWLKDYYNSEKVQQFIKQKRSSKPTFWKYDYVERCFMNCKLEFWKNGFATFDDLNYLAIQVLKSNVSEEITARFPLIIVDECQDLSGNELEVLYQLQEKTCSIHFIGDLNQSIYEFKRVDPKEIRSYVKNFEHYVLKSNFRSCKEIVEFSEKIIGQSDSISENVKSKFGTQSLIYIEYNEPEEAIEKYEKLLKVLNCSKYDNKILVKQNSLRKHLERSTHKEFDDKEPLIVAVQLWRNKTPKQMKSSLELAGEQISKWFGGGRTKRNYYCPQEISSAFRWRIFIMEVLNAIELSNKLSGSNLTYGKWHEYARKELNDILGSRYDIIANYDENTHRDLDKIVDGNNFKVSNGNKDKVISDVTDRFNTDIPIMTIHSSKGCTFDTTLVISSKNIRSEGGHWKAHWIGGNEEEKRVGYVACTRAKYLLAWGVPKLKSEDRELLENFGFINCKSIMEV